MEGFRRIGRYCIAERRSLWFRHDGPDSFSLRAGREGEDASVSVRRQDCPSIYDDLLDCIGRAPTEGMPFGVADPDDGHVGPSSSPEGGAS